jgi:cell division initiation protein
MKLTPLDIRHKEFKRGMRGYTEVDVDEFLDNVADEFERVFKENIELSERLDALQEQINHYRNIEETLQKTLVSAQQTAEGVKSSADKESQLILRDADMRARDLVGEAERKARDLVNEAYVTKQTIEKETVVLQNAEADFRFKFRQLLEGYLKQIGAFDGTARQRAGQFERRVEELKGAIASGGTTEEMPKPAVEQAIKPEHAFQPAAAAEAAPQEVPAPAAPDAPKPEEETVVSMPVRPVAVPQPVEAVPLREAAAPPVTLAPEPSKAESAPAIEPEAPEAPSQPDEAQPAAGVEPQPRPAKPHVEHPWWEPIPPEGDEPEDDQTKATPLDRQAQEDVAALRGIPEEEPDAPEDKPAEKSRFPEDDEFLSDVDDTVGDNEFKW